jgi:uncharacterized hydrophobic protein (TIGR00271 family)
MGDALSTGHRRRDRRVLFGHTSPDDRRRVLEAIAIRPSEGWWLRFGLMFSLSVVIASVGLLQNSTAVVIGAMLVAPLMTPILGLAAGVAMGSPGRVALTLGVIVGAGVSGIAISWALGGWWGGNALTAEVLARTSPDIRDLIVAAAAGAAGAYATIRSDLSGSLAGAGVAVALVPPIAAIGLTLRAGRSDLSTGALLLLATNVTAIVLASVVVFLATGFVPPRLVSLRLHRVVSIMLVAMVVAVAVCAPLVVATNRLAERSRIREDVNRAVLSWLDGTDLELQAVAVGDESVRVDLVGRSQPPAEEPLQKTLRSLLGRPVVLDTRWVQQSAATKAVAMSVLDLTSVRLIVEQWLSGVGEDAEVTSLALVANELSLSVSSSAPPPAASLLGQALTDRFGTTPGIDVQWIRRPIPSNADANEEKARSIVAGWIKGTKLSLSDLSIVANDSMIVDLVGPTPPPDVSGLRLQLAALAPGLRVTVRFTTRVELLDPTTTTTTTTSTTTSTTPATSTTPTTTPG